MKQECNFDTQPTFALFEESIVPHVRMEFTDIYEVVDSAFDIRNSWLNYKGETQLVLIVCKGSIVHQSQHNT